MAKHFPALHDQMAWAIPTSHRAIHVENIAKRPLSVEMGAEDALIRAATLAGPPNQITHNSATTATRHDKERLFRFMM